MGTNTCPTEGEPRAVGAHVSLYLAQADGVVEGLGAAVEVHGLFDVLLTLVLPGQVIGGCPVPRFICYFSSLQRELCSFISLSGMIILGAGGSRLPYLLNVALKAVDTD